MGNVLPATAWSAMRPSPVCRWCVELVDDFGSMVIRPLQDMTNPVNTVLIDGVKNVWLAGPPVELLIQLYLHFV